MCHHIFPKNAFLLFLIQFKNQHLIRFFLFIKRSVFFYPLCQFFTSHYIYLPDSIYATLLLFFRPYEMCISGFKTIDQNILSGTETIGNCHKICPVCRFLNCHPTLQGGLFHNLIPQNFILHNRFIQFCQNTSKIKTVACCTIFCDTESNVLCVRKDPPLLATYSGNSDRCVHWPILS